MRSTKNILALCLAMIMALCFSGLALAADAQKMNQTEIKKETKAATTKVEKKTVKMSKKPEAKAKSMAKKAPAKKVNINTASAKELEKLAGVGPKYAKAIVDYRKKHGKFKKAEDLMKVKGIGKKTFAANKTNIVIK
jgi:competence ComEA-like helix-hairpin-helix protein